MTAVAEVATLAWGYTLDDVNRLARQAASATRSRGGTAFGQDRYEEAWCGIVEKLYEATEHPERRDLFVAGYEAVSAQWTQHMQSHQARWVNGEPITGPNFEKYWRPITSASDDDFTDRVAERLALPQLLSLLTDLEYEALMAKSVHDKPEDAARALGIDRTTLYRRVKSAREKILTAWYAPETPHEHKVGETCGSGHSRAEHGIQYVRKDGSLTWHCRICKRNNKRRRAAKGDREAMRAQWRKEWREGQERQARQS